MDRDGILLNSNMSKLEERRFESERLLFRPFEIDDANDVFEYGKCKETCKFLAWGPYNNVSEAKEFVSKKIIEQDFQWAIVHKQDRKVIGTIRLYDDVTEKGSIAISYIQSNMYCGRGYMTESLKCMIELATNKFCPKHIYVYFDEKNVKSEGVMKRAGLKRDMTYEENMWIKKRSCVMRRYYL